MEKHWEQNRGGDAMRVSRRIGALSFVGLFAAGLLIGCGLGSDKDGTLILTSPPFPEIQGRTDVTAVLIIGGKSCPLAVDTDTTLSGQCPGLSLGTFDYRLEYRSGGVVIAQASGTVTIPEGGTGEIAVPALDTALDNDGDGYINLYEVLAGTSPSNPNDKPFRLAVTRSGVGTGTVTGTGLIGCGADYCGFYHVGIGVDLTATADAGYRFAGWGGDCTGTGPSTTVTMSADKTCTAAFDGIWTISTVDFAGTVGQYASLALDAANKAHIAYYDATNGDLKYVAEAMGWIPETIDFAGTVGQYASLALDSTNQAHIAYYDATLGDLKYVTNPLGSWGAPDTVDFAGDVGPSVSIAVDSNDKAHIAYYDASNTALKYATNAGGSWVSSMVENSSDVGPFASLAVDGTGNKRYIGYYDATNGDLKYAESITPVTLFSDDFESGLDLLKWTAGGPWGLTMSSSYGGLSSVTDSPAGNYGSSIDVSLAMANPVTITGIAGLSFYHQYSTEAGFDVARVDISTDGGMTWSILPPVYSGLLAVWTPVSIDLSSYVNQAVKIRFRLITDGSGVNDGWYIDDVVITQSYSASTIDNSVDVGPYASIALDSANQVHMSYYDASNKTLKYATNASGSWVASTIDAAGDVGRDSDIAIDSNGNVHISYYDLTNHALKYATNASGAWATYAIDSAGNVGQYTSIAVDSNETVHIAYYDAANGDLKYATNQ